MAEEGETKHNALQEYLELLNWRELLKKWYQSQVIALNMALIQLEPHIDTYLDESPTHSIAIPENLGPPGKVKRTRRVTRQSLTQNRMTEALVLHLTPKFAGILSADEVKQVMAEVTKTIWTERPVVSEKTFIERTYAKVRHKRALDEPEYETRS